MTQFKPRAKILGASHQQSSLGKVNDGANQTSLLSITRRWTLTYRAYSSGTSSLFNVFGKQEKRMEAWEGKG